MLLLHNHAFHLSNEALDWAFENGVFLLSFPSHRSYRMQPLDVSVYGPVKAYYKSQCIAWQINHAGQFLELRQLPGLFRSALDLTPESLSELREKQQKKDFPKTQKKTTSEVGSPSQKNAEKILFSRRRGLLPHLLISNASAVI